MSQRPAKITKGEIARTLLAAAEVGFDVGGFTVNHSTGEVSIFGKGNAMPSQGISAIDKMLGTGSASGGIPFPASGTSLLKIGTEKSVGGSAGS